MKKRSNQNTLRFLLVIVIALSTGCAPSTVIVSPTATSQPTVKPTNTQTPHPTNTPELIQPKGMLIYSDSEAVYSLDLQSKKARPIINTGTKSYPSPVVDNNFVYILKPAQIVDSKIMSTNQLFRINLDGTKSEQLTFDEDTYLDKFSLSGALNSENLAYVKKGKTYSIVIYDKNQKSTKVITDKKSFDYSPPSWSPDGKKFVFFKAAVSKRSTMAVQFGNLFLYSLDDGKIIELLPGEIVPMIGPSWSPDGKNIILSRLNGTNYEGVDIWTLNVESSFTEKIVDGKYMAGGSQFGWFNWSPNANMVLYTDFFQDALYLLDLHSKKITKVSAESQRLASLGGSWSPDGEFIAYFTSSGKPPLRIPFILNIQNIHTGKSLQFEIPGDVWIYTNSWIYP
jgi:hypothetical protein